MKTKSPIFLQVPGRLITPHPVACCNVAPTDVRLQHVSVTPVTIISMSYNQAIPSIALYFFYPAEYESTTHI